MPSFARERVRVLRKFAGGGIRQALARTLDTDPAKLGARFHRIEHHQAHLASAFYCSPYERAALLSADGLGDFASTMWGTGAGPRMEIQGTVAFPHSLGLYYTAVTQYLGFLKFGDEYKVMGLAAYGQPEQFDVFRDIVRTNGRADDSYAQAAIDLVRTWKADGDRGMLQMRVDGSGSVELLDEVAPLRCSRLHA